MFSTLFVFCIRTKLRQDWMSCLLLQMISRHRHHLLGLHRPSWKQRPSRLRRSLWSQLPSPRPRPRRTRRWWRPRQCHLILPWWRQCHLILPWRTQTCRTLSTRWWRGSMLLAGAQAAKSSGVPPPMAKSCHPAHPPFPPPKSCDSAGPPMAMASQAPAPKVAPTATDHMMPPRSGPTDHMIPPDHVPAPSPAQPPGPRPRNYMHQWRDLKPLSYGRDINPRHVPCPVMKLGLDNQSMDVIVIPFKHHMII